MRRPNSGNAAFTLAETTVASAVVAIIAIAILMGGDLLQRAFVGSDGSVKAAADQSRILDYIARDVHQALTASVTNNGETLTLSIPAYLDPGTGQPVTPTISSTQVNYGNPLSVTYFPANAQASPSTPYAYQTAGAYLIRQVCLNSPCNPGDSNTGTTQTVISLDSTNLNIAFTDLSSSTQVNIQTKITFAPRFNFTNQTSDRDGTAIYASAISKNPKR